LGRPARLTRGRSGPGLGGRRPNQPDPSLRARPAHGGRLLRAASARLSGGRMGFEPIAQPMQPSRCEQRQRRGPVPVPHRRPGAQPEPAGAGQDLLLTAQHFELEEVIREQRNRISSNEPRGDVMPELAESQPRSRGKGGQKHRLQDRHVHDRHLLAKDSKPSGLGPDRSRPRVIASRPRARLIGAGHDSDTKGCQDQVSR
jgi:hypothetical protein